MKKDTQLILLVALAGFGAWLWFTRGGQAIARTAGATVSKGVSFVESLIRGERNNNPGNIRISSNAWRGKVPVAQNTDGAFEQFDTAENGIRALGKLLLSYAKNYGLNTVRKLINRYAPPSENITSSYISAVAGALGVTPDTPIVVSNPATLFSLAKAIIRHENGRMSYADATIQEGVSRALA